MTEINPRIVQLRQEKTDRIWRFLSAYVDETGNLHIDGHDLGPVTVMMSNDGENEWFSTVKAVDVPRLLELLGGKPGDDILDLLEAHYTGDGSYELMKRLRESDIIVMTYTYP